MNFKPLQNTPRKKRKIACGSSSSTSTSTECS